MVDIETLAQQINDQTAKSGFWDTERNMGEMLMLIVSELSEALEEHRDGKPVMYKSYTGKPEGIVIEIADAAIRALDTVLSVWEPSAHGSMNDWFVEEHSAQAKSESNVVRIGENLGENLMRATDMVCRCRPNPYWFIRLLVYLDRLSTNQGMSLWEAVEIKMKYNATRAYKHGKAY